jgi:hypothetical protein
MAAKRRTSKSVKVGMIPDILGALDSLLEVLDEETSEDIGYRLDALTTMCLDAKLVSRQRLQRLKFHVVIEELPIDLGERDTLSGEMETFEDLMNAYGDEPSEGEKDEAREILERVINALKAAFKSWTDKSQRRLDLGQ